MRGSGVATVLVASVRAPSDGLAAGGGQLAIVCASGTCCASGIAWPAARLPKKTRTETRLKNRITWRTRASLPRESGTRGSAASLLLLLFLGLAAGILRRKGGNHG